MPTNNPIAAVRREAKTRARKGGIGHQQALDEISRERGYAHWADMLAKVDKSRKEVATTTGIHFQMDEMPFLKGPEPESHEALEIISKIGRGHASILKQKLAQRVGVWIWHWMREASQSVLDGFHRHHRKDPERPAIKTETLDARFLAEIIDPEGGAWEDMSGHLVKCPVHESETRDMVITGEGMKLGVHCLEGCDHEMVNERIRALVHEAIDTARDFMAANDKAKVMEGYVKGPMGIGGRGGVYTLTDGSVHDLPLSACRMLAEGYPHWIHGKVRPKLYAVEMRLRKEIMGTYHIEVEQPKDGERDVWRMHVTRMKDCVLTVEWGGGQDIGISMRLKEKGAPRPDERHPDIETAVKRVLHLLREPQSTDPIKVERNRLRIEREKAWMASITGTVDGWGWFAGPYPDEFSWGGPYKERQHAIGEANGNCMEDGEKFYVIHAYIGEGAVPDENGYYHFQKTRKLASVKSK